MQVALAHEQARRLLPGRRTQRILGKACLQELIADPDRAELHHVEDAPGLAGLKLDVALQRARSLAERIPDKGAVESQPAHTELAGDGCGRVVHDPHGEPVGRPLETDEGRCVRAAQK